MRKILLFTLMLAMTFSLYSGANAEASSTSTDLLAVKLEKQKDGVRAYQEIVKTLKSSNKSLNSKYAGAYIDDDGNLNVRIIGKKDGNIAEVKSIAKSDKIIFHDAKYSMDELLKLMEQIGGSMEKLRSQGITINELMLSEKDNSVVVFVQELDQEKSRVIKELFNSDAIVIKPSEGPIKPTITNCDPGGQVAVYSGTNFKGYASVAFGAKDANGKLGLVSCGHDLSIGDTVYAVYPGEKIGTITKLKFSDNCDASFIEISNPNYTTSPRLHFQNTARITNVIFSTLPEGTAVAAYPNEFKYGKIISNNGWGFVGLTVITDMYKTDFPLAKGDSGCPLLYENKKGSEYSLIGQTTGTGVSGGCFVKFANVYSSLGLSWYHIQP